jgi:hypothetical protein
MLLENIGGWMRRRSWYLIRIASYRASLSLGRDLEEGSATITGHMVEVRCDIIRLLLGHLLVESEEWACKATLSVRSVRCLSVAKSVFGSFSSMVIISLAASLVDFWLVS